MNRTTLNLSNPWIGTRLAAALLAASVLAACGEPAPQDSADLQAPAGPTSPSLPASPSDGSPPGDSGDPQAQGQPGSQGSQGSQGPAQEPSGEEAPMDLATGNAGFDPTTGQNYPEQMTPEPPESDLPGGEELGQLYNQIDASCGTLQCACQRFEELGYINARCYGANGADTIDDTNALQAALNAGGVNRPVFIPGGTYRISRPLDVSAKKVVGVRHWRPTQGGTVIQVVLPSGSAPISSVLRANSNPLELQSLIVNGNNQAQYGVHLEVCHGARLQNLSAIGTLTAGYYFNRSQNNIYEQLAAFQNRGDGFLVDDGNASRFFNTVSHENQGHGMRIRGVTNSGGVFMYGGNIERVGKTAILVENAQTPVLIQSFWMEPGDRNVDDVIRLSNTRHAQIIGNLAGCIGGQGANGMSTNHFIKLTNGSANNMIERNVAAYGGGNAGCASISVVDDASRFNHFDANLYMSQNASLPMTVHYGNGAFRAEDQVNMHATSAPTAGYWTVGSVIFNSRPAAGRPMGWMCTASGAPGTWRAMPNLP